MMFRKNPYRLIFVIAVVLAVTGYFAGLFIDVTRDAGKYATVAREIFQNGNFINLTVHGMPYDQKPPMLFWLGAIGFFVGGISNFWFKLPVLLVVFAGIYWAYRLGYCMYNKRVGFLTATFLLFSVIYSLYSMDIHTDTLLQAFVTLALWQLYSFIKTGKNRHWILGFTGVGLAMLSKGPVGAAIPAFAVAGHLLLTKNYRSFADYRWYLGVILSFVIVSPALFGLMNQFGLEGLKFFFWDNNIGRITGSYVKAVNDPFFYVHTLAYLFLPWSLLFFIAAYHDIKSLIKYKFRAQEYFTFTGIWIYFIILNSASSQLPNYVFSIVPLIAVLTAKWIDHSIEQNQKLLHQIMFGQGIIVALLWISVFLVVLYFFPNPDIYIWFILFAGLASTVLVFRKNNNSEIRLLLPSVIVTACITLIFNLHVFPFMFSYQAPPKAAKYFTENARNGDMLYNYKYPQYELFFYSDPQAKQIYSDEEMKNVAGKPGIWIFTDEEGFEEIKKTDSLSGQVIEYRHLYLNRGGRFLNPKTREQVLRPMYLIKY